MKIGETVTVLVDRPRGSSHPDYPDTVYTVNYGYIQGVMANDGEAQDVYILGVKEPLNTFTGKVIAVIHRFDDQEDKLVVAPDGLRFSAEEIQAEVYFAEKYFQTEILL